MKLERFFECNEKFVIKFIYFLFTHFGIESHLKMQLLRRIGTWREWISDVQISYYMINCRM